MAVSAVANIVRSSLGPLGLDKMLVDDVGVSFYLIVLIRIGSPQVICLSVLLVLISRHITHTLMLITYDCFIG